jgi:hypothetical protein
MLLPQGTVERRGSQIASGSVDVEACGKSGAAGQGAHNVHASSAADGSGHEERPALG